MITYEVLPRHGMPSDFIMHVGLHNALRTSYTLSVFYAYTAAYTAVCARYVYADVAQSVERGPSKSNVARSNRVIRLTLISKYLAFKAPLSLTISYVN